MPCAMPRALTRSSGETGGRSPLMVTINTLLANWSSSAAMPLLSDSTQCPKAGRTLGSPARRSVLTGDMIVRLSKGSTGGGFGGIGVGIEIPEVGEGREIGDEKVA